jgi:ribosomal-protein-alanine N-acetyltransferase
MAEALTAFGSPLEIKAAEGEITLRQFTVSDTEEIFALIDRNREHLSQNHEPTAKKYQTRDQVERSITHPKDKNRLRFGIRNEKGELVGSINLTPNETYPEKAEIGYYLGAEFTHTATGKDYVGEALKLLTHFAFRHLKFDELYADVWKDNHPSEKVLLRCGFSRKENKGDHIIFNLVKPTHFDITLQ